MSAPVIILTGASRGLGESVARLLAPVARLMLVARSATRLQALTEELGEATFVAGDLSEQATVSRCVEQTLERWGRIDALINNAGVIEPIAPLAQADFDLFRRNIEVNLIAPAALMQACLPHLRQQRGRIVNINSGAAVKTMVGWSSYCTAKAGLLHLTNNLAQEEPDVTFISLRPGVIDTDMQQQIRGSSGMEDAAHQKFLDLHQSGQLEPPEVPARAAAWLALKAPTEWSGEFVNYSEERVALPAQEFFGSQVGL